MSKPEDSEWHLAHVTAELKDGRSQPSTKIDAKEIIDIGELDNDIGLITKYFTSLQLVDSVKMNLAQFLEAIVHYADRFLKKQTMGEGEFGEISLNFSRLFLNVLSMFRSFLDHSDSSIAKYFGKESPQWKEWKDIQSKHYDSMFEYRLFYKLRNYCQHVGMPPMHIQYSSSMDREGITFQLDLQRDQLLKNKSCWNAQLLKDLNACPEHIPVINAMDNWSGAFNDIARTLLEIKRQSALNASEIIMSHRSRLGLHEYEGYLYAVKIPKDAEPTKGFQLQVRMLPERKAFEILKGNPFDQKDDDKET